MKLQRKQKILCFKIQYIMFNALNIIRENFSGVVKMNIEITILEHCISYISHLSMYLCKHKFFIIGETCPNEINWCDRLSLYNRVDIKFNLLTFCFSYSIE